jgi:hypothetical protein
VLHHPQSGHLLASAGAAAIGTLSAGFTAIFLAAADTPPAPAADAGATQLYLLCGVALIFIGGLVKNAVDLRKGILQATAGTDRERADKLQAQIDEMGRRHAAEITELTRRHTAEVADLVKSSERHKGIVAESLARSHEQARQIEEMNAVHRELIETNRDLTRRIAELSKAALENNKIQAGTARILAEKAQSPASSDAIPTGLAPAPGEPREPLPITIVPGSEPVPTREVDGGPARGGPDPEGPA